jgi:hypothetical protein
LGATLLKGRSMNGREVCLEGSFGGHRAAATTRAPCADFSGGAFGGAIGFARGAFAWDSNRMPGEASLPGGFVVVRVRGVPSHLRPARRQSAVATEATAATTTSVAFSPCDP